MVIFIGKQRVSSALFAFIVMAVGAYGQVHQKVPEKETKAEQEAKAKADQKTLDKAKEGVQKARQRLLKATHHSPIISKRLSPAVASLHIENHQLALDYQNLIVDSLGNLDALGLDHWEDRDLSARDIKIARIWNEALRQQLAFYQKALTKVLDSAQDSRAWEKSVKALPSASHRREAFHRIVNRNMEEMRKISRGMPVVPIGPAQKAAWDVIDIHGKNDGEMRRTLQQYEDIVRKIHRLEENPLGPNQMPEGAGKDLVQACLDRMIYKHQVLKARLENFKEVLSIQIFLAKNPHLSGKREAYMKAAEDFYRLKMQNSDLQLSILKFQAELQKASKNKV